MAHSKQDIDTSISASGLLLDKQKDGSVARTVRRDARVARISFGSVIVTAQIPKQSEIRRNIRLGQIAFKRAREAFITKGVKLDVKKGIALYQADPNNPKFLIRDIDGKKERGCLVDGQFKVMA